VQGLDALLVDRLDGHGADFPVACGLDNGGGIVAVGLAAADVGADILGGEQADAVAHGLQLTCPVMGCAAGLKDKRNRRVLGAEAMGLFSVEALTVDDAPGAVGAGEFEDVLCEVNGDERSIHVGLLLFFTRLTTSSLWHYDAGKERQGKSISSPQSDGFAAAGLNR